MFFRKVLLRENNADKVIYIDQNETGDREIKIDNLGTI